MKWKDLKNARVDVGTSCVEGKIGDYRGYASRGHGRYEHRDAWARANGPIPAGLEIDHLCRNRACVNPDHLEAVSHAENVRRAYALVTECAQGHPFSAENTHVRPNGFRDCKTCVREWSRRARQKKQAAWAEGLA